MGKERERRESMQIANLHTELGLDLGLGHSEGFPVKRDMPLTS